MGPHKLLLGGENPAAHCSKSMQDIKIMKCVNILLVTLVQSWRMARDAVLGDLEGAGIGQPPKWVQIRPRLYMQQKMRWQSPELVEWTVPLQSAGGIVEYSCHMGGGGNS